MNEEQAKFIEFIIDKCGDVDYIYIAKSFYKKFGSVPFYRGPYIITDKNHQKVEVYSKEDGKQLYETCLKILNYEC